MYIQSCIVEPKSPITLRCSMGLETWKNKLVLLRIKPNQLKT